MALDIHATLPALLPRLVAFARTIVSNSDTARDLVQEAVARALGARRVPDDAAAYRAWMFRIVRNAALDELRRKRLEPRSSMNPRSICGALTTPASPRSPLNRAWRRSRQSTATLSP